MPEQTAIPFYYTVRLAPRDPAEMLHGALYDLRRAYYESGKRGRVSSHSAYNGFPCHTQGFLSRHNLKWQRRIGHQIREEAFRFEKGHALLLRNEQGALIGRIVYGAEQQWLRSAYLIPGQAEPQVVLQPGPEPGTLQMLTRTNSGSFQKKTLYPAPFSPGTLVQSMVNAKYGEPDVTASTSQGDFCYTSRDESEKRALLLRQITSGTVSAMPQWQGEVSQPEAPHPPKSQGEKVYQSGGSWVYDNLKKWESGKTYKFAAYAVKDGIALPENVFFDYGTHTLTIEGYTSNDNYQTDLLMAASAEDLNPDNVPVPFSFGHALAMVKFTLKSGLGTNEITITDFTVSGMHTTGDVSLAQGGDITWANQAAEGTPVSFTDDSWTAITTTAPQASDEFVVIPQTGTTITVSFTATVNGEPKSLTSTITLDGNGWECGKRYNYVATITASDMDYIEFAPPAVSDWGGYTDVDADID